MLETERLILRRFTTRDISPLLNHRSDKQIMKFLGGTQDVATVKQKVKFYNEHYDEDGYAFCAMLWKETGDFIGVGGLQTSRQTGETEVGYTVEKDFWGKGIATECTNGCLKFGFEKIKLERIIAQTHAKNLASIRVLEKAGMKFDENFENNGEKWVRYAITKDLFQNSSEII